jgi:uncharacterized membrane protein
METIQTSRTACAVWRRLIYVAAGLVLAVWLINTPAGLLGKADAVGYSVCHRIDSHSFHLGGRELPLCARCSGMYLGALLGIAFQDLRRRRGGLPPLRVNLVLGVLLLAFTVDGINSYMHFFPGVSGLYTPQNWLRLVTGSGIGLGIAAILMPVFHQTVWKAIDERSALESWRRLGTLLILAAGLDALIAWQNPLALYPLALLSAAGVVVILILVYTLIWVMAFHRENSFPTWRALIPWLTAGFTSAMLQIGLVDLLRYAVFHSWAGFTF